jgi:hypothetical protein
MHNFTDSFCNNSRFVLDLSFQSLHSAIYSDHGHAIASMWLNECKFLNVLYLLIMISELRI